MLEDYKIRITLFNSPHVIVGKASGNLDVCDFLRGIVLLKYTLGYKSL